MRPPTVQRDPVMSPGVCYFCRVGNSQLETEDNPSGNRHYFVDLGADVDYEGVIYMCDLCLKDMIKSARVPDIIAMADVNKIIDESRYMQAEARRVIDTHKLVEDHLNSLGLNYNELLAAAQRNFDANEAVNNPVEKIEPMNVQLGISEEALRGEVLDPQIVAAQENLPVNDDGAVNTEVTVELETGDESGVRGADDSATDGAESGTGTDVSSPLTSPESISNLFGEVRPDWNG